MKIYNTKLSYRRFSH